MVLVFLGLTRFWILKIQSLAKPQFDFLALGIYVMQLNTEVMIEVMIEVMFMVIMNY